MKLKKKSKIRLCGFEFGELSHETCSYVCVYTNAVSNSVMSQLYNDMTS